MVERLLAAVMDWAGNRHDITGIALVGSHARGQARPDSDVDLVLLTTEPAGLLEDAPWVKTFGKVASLGTEHWGNVTSLRVWYERGPEVEFGISTPDWAALPPDPGAARVVRDGMTVLLDRHGALKAFADAVSRDDHAAAQKGTR